MGRGKHRFRKGELVAIRQVPGDPPSPRVRLALAAGHGYLWVVEYAYGDQDVWLKSIATGELRSFVVRNVIPYTGEQDAEDT